MLGGMSMASVPEIATTPYAMRGSYWCLIIAGMHAPDVCLHAALEALAADPSVAIFADATANLHGLACVPAHADAALGTADAATDPEDETRGGSAPRGG